MILTHYILLPNESWSGLVQESFSSKWHLQTELEPNYAGLSKLQIIPVRKNDAKVVFL